MSRAAHQRFVAMKAQEAQNVQTDFTIADPFKRIKTRKMRVAVREPNDKGSGLVSMDIPVYLKTADPMGFAIRVPDYVGALMSGERSKVAQSARYAGPGKRYTSNTDTGIEIYKDAYVVIRHTDAEVVSAFEKLQDEYVEMKQASRIQFAKFLHVQIGGWLVDHDGTQVIQEDTGFNRNKAEQSLSLAFSVVWLDVRDVDNFRAWKLAIAGESPRGSIDPKNFTSSSWRATTYKALSDGGFERSSTLSIDKTEALRGGSRGFNTVIQHTDDLESALRLIESGLVNAGRRLLDLFRRDDFEATLVRMMKNADLPALELTK